MNRVIEYKQDKHSIIYSLDDVIEAGEITPYNVTYIEITECGDMWCVSRQVPQACATCFYPHKQKVFMDGWEVKLDVDKYYVKLKTGIRVPVDKEVYDYAVHGLLCSER